MIDKKLEKKIDKLRDFRQSWLKFYEIYNKTIKKDSLSKEDEKTFLSERDVIKRKYHELIQLLEIEKVAEYADPILDILNTQELFSASDSQYERIEEDWGGSFLFLKNMIKAFEEKRFRVRESWGLVYLLNKALSNICFIIIATLILIFLAYYMLIKYVIVK